ncbi:hypothetical protein MW887_001805 [Aspergillus wentii]|nr:hypothetical protein MW887_001805 [Aspergillus wentii]
MERIEEWKEIHHDKIQDIFDIFDKGYGSAPDAQNEYISRLMADYRVDRNHAKAELEKHHGDLEAANRACAEHARLAKTRLETEAVIPTRDTRRPPDVTPRDRVIPVLGVDESSPSSQAACPSLGDGWMVSDFYMWMHVLQGMGKSQEWITSMTPKYLIEKYGREDRTTMSSMENDEVGVEKPVQTKWSSGFVHGDPFEPRKVVLDGELLPLVQEKVTIGPKGKSLRDFFLQRLADIVTEAAASGDRVLIMIFAHGNYDTLGGLGIGMDSSEGRRDPNGFITPKHIKSILLPFPHTKVTIYMTSCYSGHWVETTEFQAIDLHPAVLAAAEKEQESFGLVWSNSQRHAAGLFSSATIGEIVKEPATLPPDTDADTSREYREVTTALVAEMHRLCPPINITSGWGSSPVFTDNESHAKFWKRPGYSLDVYKRNYDRLRTIPASDRRRELETELVDRNDPEILAWQERHPGVLDEDYLKATGGYARVSYHGTSPLDALNPCVLFEGIGP